MLSKAEQIFWICFDSQNKITGAVVKKFVASFLAEIYFSADLLTFFFFFQEKLIYRMRLVKSDGQNRILMAVSILIPTFVKNRFPGMQKKYEKNVF